MRNCGTLQGTWLGDNPHIVVLGSRNWQFCCNIATSKGSEKEISKLHTRFLGSEITKDFEAAFMETNNEENLGLTGEFHGTAV